ncbi:Sds3-like-domain-containing protein [Lasiosphaeria miniovina]|uniref:Sds3-like-domain-containing protein n=1 Tax=Lasiosphaeria miniovina TaxID=1954250 RepID=A0AA40BIK9_9PEZI|nr:Sds3-like-domain-containing protein [Lasiosphaeria miniovina]KAK0734895.1 Sds3-like-domain-containing protein [Lasiosphaeria miniovina]
MATGDTAPPLALSSSPPPMLGQSPSNLSSPLSDVEDKDAEADDADMDMHTMGFSSRLTPKRDVDGDGGASDADSESDEESKLSEMDVNDSEAETERLYDTPPKVSGARDLVDGVGDVGNRQFVDRRDRVFERSPSKLQQQLKAQASLNADDAVSDNNSLSEGEDEEDDDASLASSEPDPEPAKEELLRPHSQAKKQEAIPSTESTTSQLTRQDSSESRKRKRSPVAEQSESEQPLRKRTGSIAAVENEFSTDDVAVIDDEGTSTNPQSGNHTGEEDNHEEPEVATKIKEIVADSVEEDTRERTRSRKAKRNAAKKRRSKSPEATSRGTEETAKDADIPVTDVAAPHAVEDHIEDDEEAEAAHKEEELERKKAAWEELTAIEKQFNSFRDRRLYQERLDQLDQEEASLTSDNPTHPEYLAMLQCLEERREERIRISSLELQFRMSVLNGRAVAERAQILSQYYQSIRESREEVLEELGQEWYDIQQERRRFANTIPDYGIRFPTTKPQTIRQAVAYNREVSVLSGFAKHVGFPAAPAISGVSDDQLESDLDAIHRMREPPSRPSINTSQANFHQGFTAGLPFGRNLGPAGEQFIESTPWANPNHPSHHLQRQNSQQEASIQTPFSGSLSGPRRHSYQQGGVFPPSNTNAMNGDSPLPVQKAHLSTGHEALRASKLGSEPVMKRESVAQAS